MRNGASLFFSSMEPAIFWHWQHCCQCFLQLSWALQVCDVHQTNLENPASKELPNVANICKRTPNIEQPAFFWVLSCKGVTLFNQFVAFKRHEKPSSDWMEIVSDFHSGHHRSSGLFRLRLLSWKKVDVFLASTKRLKTSKYIDGVILMKD